MINHENPVLKPAELKNQIEHTINGLTRQENWEAHKPPKREQQPKTPILRPVSRSHSRTSSFSNSNPSKTPRPQVRRSRSLNRDENKVTRQSQEMSIHDQIENSVSEDNHKRKLSFSNSPSIRSDSPVNKKASFFQTTIEQQATGRSIDYICQMKLAMANSKIFHMSKCGGAAKYFRGVLKGRGYFEQEHKNTLKEGFLIFL